jgi:hypothetical protein
MPRPASSVRLFTTDTPGAAWQHVIAPWLENVNGSASAVVVTPNRPVANALKALRLTSGRHLLGTRFLLPGALRGMLARAQGLEFISPETHDLELLATLASGGIESPAARSIARSPRGFVRFRQQLAASGWQDEAAQPQPVILAFDRLRESLDWPLESGVDRTLFAAPIEGVQSIEHLLLFGFDALHWPLYPLLAAATRSAASATVILSQPRIAAEEPDELWLGTWEEEFGASQPIPAAETERPFLDVLEISSQLSLPRADIDFVVGEDVAALAGSIAAMALAWLAGESDARIGIVFPAAGPLSRLVSKRLQEAGIPHADQLGYRQPGPLEEPAWASWLRLQESHRPSALVALVEECPALAALFAGASAGRLEGTLANAREWHYFGDLDALAEFLRGKDDPLCQDVATGLRALALLPERATAATFVADTRRSFVQLGWENRLAILDEAPWLPKLDGELTRRAFLAWLDATMSTWMRGREAAGSQPYSRVQLVTFAHAESQEWTHAILCGLNEGEWPAPQEETAWLSEPEIAALNARAVRLNRRALKRGSQGEGHRIVAPGHTLWLTPAHQRALALRQFTAIIENTRTRIVAAATLRDERDPSRLRQPGEFFTRLHLSARGRPAGAETMRTLAAETNRWLKSAKVFDPVAPVVSSDTLAAWKARRDASQPFGEYEFARKTPPASALLLSASDLESALLRPAEIWLKHVLRVEARSDEHDDVTALVIGKWSHAWLATAVGSAAEGLRERPDAAEFAKRVRKAAADFRNATSEILARLGRELPDWWISIWRQALALAVAIAERVGGLQEWPYLAPEWKLGTEEIPLGNGPALRTKGRVDLVLSATAKLGEGPAMIIDYKTGAKMPLKVTKLAEGDGTQLALYVLAMRATKIDARGASRVSSQFSLGDAPQVSVDDLAFLDPLWQGLARMEHTGIFGWHGPLRSEHGVRASYPLATLAVDMDILDTKWRLTHPSLNEEVSE